YFVSSLDETIHGGTYIPFNPHYSLFPLKKTNLDYRPQLVSDPNNLSKNASSISLQLPETNFAAVRTFGSPIPILSIPALFAASIPAKASSKTTQFTASKPNFLAAIKKTSGSGLAMVT